MTATPMPAGAADRAAASRRRQSHQVHSAIDAASSTSAARRRACVSVRGRTSAAATVSTTPCSAATSLRQRRGGSGARIHGSSQFAGEEQVARGPDRSTHRRTPGRRRRSGRGSGTRRPRRRSAPPARSPCRCAAPAIRRPGRGTSATAASVTSRPTGVSWLNECRGERGDADGERGPGERDPGGQGRAAR